MLWFLGTEDLSHRDVLVEFCRKFQGTFEAFPKNYFGEGYRPVPKGVSKFLFLTRAFHPGRVREAFLRFTSDKDRTLRASTALGTEFEISKSDLLASLRTSVALNRMDVSALHDYVASGPYAELRKVRQAAGHSAALPEDFWRNVHRELLGKQTQIVVARRLDFGSPNFHLTCWTSDTVLSPSNQVNVIREKDTETAHALCALLNSVLFWAQFFLLKEQSHARYFDIRFYDLHEMPLFPGKAQRKALAAIYRKYKACDFPPFRAQLDRHYTDRYREYWESQYPATRREKFREVWNQPINPADLRINLDMEVCEAVGLAVTPNDLVAMYEVLAKEIIFTRRLAKD
jgi:hypothetical protein